MFSYSILKQISKETKQFVRYRNPPDHWSEVRRKVHPVDKALNHFDDFYKQVFNKKWESIRKGLLGQRKYVAVVNNYGDCEETMSKLELMGALNMRTLFKLEKGYIQEELDMKKRNIKLREIFRMDKTIDKIIEKKKETVVEAEITPNQFSLDSSLKKAEYDTSRIVDARNALSAEILSEFVPATKIKGKEDFIPESSHYRLYDKDTQSGFRVEKEYDLHFPEYLNIYCYEGDSESDFESPKRGSTGVYNYYLMDGGSTLPVLALDIKPGQKVLDMCAAPGGKSLLALQTLYPECVVSNDVSNSRLNRIQNVYDQFLFDFHEKWLKEERVKLTNIDGRFIVEDNFDRILVDVPCTTDRHSLHENENNMFKPSRIKERLKLPELQTELLFHALKLVRKGGIVVYSTCSLSPIQNDGVVHMALQKIWQETNIQIVVKDLTPALVQSRNVFELADRRILKYGHLVLPCLSQNYGPTYFCKLQKIN